MTSTALSTQTLQRLPLYLDYLKNLPPAKRTHISAKAIALNLGLHEVQVRKDLAAVSDSGHPRVGYDLEELVRDLDRAFSGFNAAGVILIGTGELGRALMSEEYGLNIFAVFDVDERNVGRIIGGHKVLPPGKIAEVCNEKGVRLGIIAVPGNQAPLACRHLVEGGVRAILNYSSVCLHTPRNVLVQNENISVSVAVLSKLLMDRCCVRALNNKEEDV